MDLDEFKAIVALAPLGAESEEKREPVSDIDTGVSGYPESA
jgi:hypothetical protein